MRLLIVSDAWHPQVNGVVRTLSELRKRLVRRGWEVLVLGPEGLTVACPTYPEIRLSLMPTRQIESLLEEWRPEAIHIATEGPMGWAMRALCLKNGWPFTTSFHTRFPEYLKRRIGLPKRFTYRFLRKFHSASSRVMVPTNSVRVDLETVGFERVVLWGRGVDTDLFTPNFPAVLKVPRPISLYVGRLAVEKNIEGFLNLKIPGTKVVVGDGPLRSKIEKQYKDVIFLGQRSGSELASFYAGADVFVFPSYTDTYGLVLLESLACGTPVAAYPTGGPIDVLTDSKVATLDLDLHAAVMKSLDLDRKACREFALGRSWDHCVDLFCEYLVPIPDELKGRPSKPLTELSSATASRYYAMQTL